MVLVRVPALTVCVFILTVRVFMITGFTTLTGCTSLWMTMFSRSLYRQGVARETMAAGLDREEIRLSFVVASCRLMAWVTPRFAGYSTRYLGSQFQCHPLGVTQRSKRLVRELTVVGVTATSP
jgi:hypothetical protein